MEHPTQDALLRFALGAASRPENRQVVRHLLGRCPACAAVVREHPREPPADPPPDLTAYDETFDRVAVFLRELARKVDPAPAGEEGGLLQGTRRILSRPPAA